MVIKMPKNEVKVPRFEDILLAIYLILVAQRYYLAYTLNILFSNIIIFFYKTPVTFFK